VNQPQSGNEMPRFAGLATMMRLPAAGSPQGLDAAFIGVPLDIGTSNRAGARFGPRQVRSESALLRPYNMATGAAPFDTLQVATSATSPSTPTRWKNHWRSSAPSTTRCWPRAAAP
jgi:guanidinobutyrase